MQHDIGALQQSIQSSISSNRRVGNYEIVRKIGEGTFSLVFLAVHTITRHEVVLKSAEKTQANIASEIANMSLLSHPHIVRLYEYIIMPDRVWLVLEYCGGQELYSYLMTTKVLSPHRAGRLFAQLAGAVAYAHHSNCAHRDLKLENVLLDDDGNIKLGDFGFTRSYVPRTMLETVCGTESYMAPELVLRQKYNPEAADVWSLGVILYAMLYGRLPFDEDNSAVTVQYIVEQDPPFPPIHKGEYLVEITKKMLCKNPSQRPKVDTILTELREPGRQQKQLISQIVNHPESSFIFSTKEERTVLKGMKALCVDLHAVAASIMYHKCDALHGLWFTALDRQRSLSKQLLDSASASTTSGLHRRRSKASMKSSLKPSKSWSTSIGVSNGGLMMHVSRDQSAPIDNSLPGNDFGDEFKDNENFQDCYSAKSLNSIHGANGMSLNGRASSPGTPTTGSVKADRRTSQMNPSTIMPINSQNVPSAVPSRHSSPSAASLPMSSQIESSSGITEKSKYPSSLTAFIEKRSKGRSRRTIDKIASVLKLKPRPPKENLLDYYDTVKKKNLLLPHDSGARTLEDSQGNFSQDTSIDENKREDKQMRTPVLDLNKDSKRQSTASYSSSLSIPIETPVRKQPRSRSSSISTNLRPESEADQRTMQVLAMDQPQESIASQNSQSSRVSASPPLTPSNMGRSIERPVSTYSQLSQMSQLSQSSVDASMIVADVQDPKNGTASTPVRPGSSLANKFAGMAVSSSAGGSTTPPGTPTFPRPRARLMSIKQNMPQKIDEGDE